MTSLYWLTDLQPHDRPLVGDRAWNLSQLAQSGYPVLPGIVISDRVRQDFLHSITWSDPLLSDFPDSSFHIPYDRSTQLHDIAQTIRDRILATPFPSQEYTFLLDAIEQWEGNSVLCRPSFSFPGKKNIIPSDFWSSWVSDKKQTSLGDRIKQIWAESFRSKSLLCWQHLGIEFNQIIQGVLIQPIHNQPVSGSIQTRDRQILIESTWGLGFALDQPDISPDCYNIPLNGDRPIENLGKKRIAYHLSGESAILALNAPLLESDSALVQPYIVDQSLTEQPSLDDRAIAELVDLTQHLQTQWHSPFHLQWIGSPPVNWQITDAISLDFSENLSKPSQPLLAGIGAAPGVAMASVVVLPSSVEEIAPGQKIAPGQIIVTAAIALSDLWHLTEAAGLITEQGGLTNHGAILARELGIPAIVGVAGATTHLISGEQIAIDGETGQIDRLSQLPSSKFPSEPSQPSQPRFLSRAGQLKPQKTKLFVNLSQPSSIAHASALDIDGVGLLRSELLAATLPNLGSDRQFVEQWSNHLQNLAQAFFPRPVYYRSFDRWNSSPDRPRGTLAYLINAESSAWFDLELTALEQLHRQGYDNLHLILPFVRTVEEVLAVRKRIDRRQLSQMQIWMMVEVPSVLFQIPDYAQAGIDGLSIGTNDLIPLLLGSDRYNCPQHQPSHYQVILNALEHCLARAKEVGLPCSICGQAAIDYPELIESLVRWGITSISVEVNAVDPVRQAIVHAERLVLLESV